MPNATVSLFLAGADTPAYTTQTTSEGTFTIPAVRPETYRGVVEAAGMMKTTIADIQVSPGRDTSLPSIALDIQSLAETVEVTAAAQGVNTTTVDVSTTISKGQILNLPTINRSPLSFLTTQAGVTYNGKTNTTINGQRVSFSNVTVDGINVQDNFIRTNALDFLPNLLLLDQVAEVTVTTSNANPALGGGSSQVVFVTPSGTNHYRGNAYFSNRNNLFAANDWFNNRDKIGLPDLNQNQLGGSVGGPIFRNKLFFYANFEAFRLNQQTSVNRTILTTDARNGIFTYKDTAGNVKKVNVLQLAGVGADKTAMDILSKVPGGDQINNFRVGDSSEALMRNTAGYSFLMRANRNRNNATGKLDYNFSTRNTFTGTWMWNSDLLDRAGTDVTNNFDLIPPVKNDNTTKFLSLGWRFNPTPALTNEVRWGYNFAPGLFLTDQAFGDKIIDGFIFTNPVNTFRAQGRYTNTYNMADNASWTRGAHTVQLGYQGQMIRVRSFNDAGITPTYNIGIGSGNTGLVANQLPGISSSDLTAANSLLASLAGYVQSYTQTFNVNSPSSGFVAGAPNERNFMLDTHGFYGQDSWKLRRRFTLTMGLRYDYFTVMKERDNLYLLPVMTAGNPINALLDRNGTLNFPGGGLYAPDRNNFAPNVGFAWDLFGDGKTSFRAGYSLSYVNDNTIRAIDNSTATNAGLSSGSTKSGLKATIQTLPQVAVPPYKVPRSYADNYAIDTTAAYAMPDPNLRTPYVQQWTAGLQRQIGKNVVEVRYVGNHGTKLFRAFDYNQVNYDANGFLADFKRAQNNGFLAQAAGLGFNPAYNSKIGGSQALTVFPLLASGGLLNNSTIRSYIQQGQVGELANTYMTNRLNGAVEFYRNPNGLGTNYITNYSNSSYNSVQVDWQRRMSAGLQYGANYTYGRMFSDTMGNQQTNFEPFLDLNNSSIERNRTGFDLTHALKVNAYYELPFGPGHKITGNGAVNRVIGGWNIAAYYFIQSGNPFSVLSGRGTLNRAARSTWNTANTTLDKGQLDNLFGVYMTGNGPYFVNANAIGPDGRAVAGDGLAPFNGQVFFQPGPGTLGQLQRNYFNAPSIWNMDFKISKMTQITERQSLELRLDASNVFNHQGWYFGDQTLTSTSFGRITSTFFNPRRLQLSLYYRF